MPDFTPTQSRILAVLSDGLAHKKAELRVCLNDEQAGDNTLSVHLTNLRKKLRPVGEDILCHMTGRSEDRGYHYQHVRLLASPYRG